MTLHPCGKTCFSSQTYSLLSLHPCSRTWFSSHPSSLLTLQLCGRTCFSSQPSSLLTFPPCCRTFFSFQPSSLQTLHLCGRTCFSSQSSRLLTLYTCARTSPNPTVWWISIPVAAITCPPIYHTLIISCILLSLVWWWFFPVFPKDLNITIISNAFILSMYSSTKSLISMQLFPYVQVLFLWSHSVSYVLAPAIL